jgi:hypothetical protein
MLSLKHCSGGIKNSGTGRLEKSDPDKKKSRIKYDIATNTELGIPSVLK